MYDKCPDQLKPPFALWTRNAVQQLIKQLWAIDMPIRTVGEYLKRWGFTPQKPLRRAYKQNPKEVEAWLNHAYPGIQKRAKEVKSNLRKRFREYRWPRAGVEPFIGHHYRWWLNA